MRGGVRERTGRTVRRHQWLLLSGVEKGRGSEARVSRRLWRIAAVDSVSRRIGARAHGGRAVTAGVSRRRPRPFRPRQPSRLAAGGAAIAAEGGARRRGSGG